MATKSPHQSLSNRIRVILANQPSVREVSMFGGLSFMVNDRMVVAAGQHGNLLARVDPERSSALLARRGAKIAEMGAGRSMGPSWLEVDQEMLDDNSLVFWVDTALEYNAKAASR